MDDMNAAVEMALSAAGACGKPLDRLLTVAAKGQETRHPVPTLIAKLKDVLNGKSIALARAIVAMHKSSVELRKLWSMQARSRLVGRVVGGYDCCTHVGEGRWRR